MATIKLISCEGPTVFDGVFLPEVLFDYVGKTILIESEEVNGKFTIENSSASESIELTNYIIKPVATCQFNSFSLISCNPNVYSSITNILEPDLTDHIGSIVSIGNEHKGYTVQGSEDEAIYILEDLEIEELDGCPDCIGFITKLDLNDNSGDCYDCKYLNIKDSSSFDNSMDGYDVWGYRRVVVNSPFRQYVLSSNPADENDGIIPVHSNGSQSEFTYPFANQDSDGIYEVELYNFPLWQEDVFYSKFMNHIVFLNGLFYKIKASNSGVSPEDDVEHNFWEPYTINESTLDTRYGDVRKVAITCLSLDSCGKDLIINSAANGGACDCDDPNYNKAMKFIVMMEALRIHSCANNWKEVAKIFEMLRNLCGCKNCN